MKNLLFCLLLVSIKSFSQQANNHFQSYRDGYKLYGYIEGKRLDSVDAQYGSFYWPDTRNITFDIGQYRDGKEALKIKDNKGLSIEPEEMNLPFILNFFYYNGWELIQVVPNINSLQSNTSQKDIYILRKRSR